MNNSSAFPASRFKTFYSLLLAGFMVSQGALAQELVYEAEPNDTPEAFNTLSGEVSIAGSMTGADQDGYLWTVSDADAEKRWTIRLDGIPGALTIIQVLRLEYAENGVDLVGTEKLFGMGSRDGAQAVFERDLLFEPGEYVLGFAHGGGGGGSFRPPVASIEFGEAESASGNEAGEAPGGYRAAIRASTRLNIRSSRVSPSEQANAQALRPGRQFASFVASENSWYGLELNEEQAASVWEIRGQLPVGQSASVYLRDAEGAQVSETRVDDHGRFAFTDLGLSAGEHFVEIRGEQANTIRVIEAVAIGQRVEGGEVEENGSWANANIVDWSVPVTGRAGEQGDQDYFRFTLDEAGADSLLELALEAGPGQAVQMCLLDGQGKRVQCRDSDARVALPKLALTPGEWGVEVRPGNEGTEYTLTLQPQGPVEPDTEVEPNDELGIAITMPSKNRIKGRFDTNGDVDFFRFLVTDEAQLWRFQLIGDGLQGISYYDGAGRQQQWTRENADRLRLDNLFLMPGQHFISVTGEPGADYTLLARPLGPPDPDGEREPNNQVGQMQRLDFGQRRNGLLTHENDEDLYRFTLYDWERIRVTLEPPADGSIQAHRYWSYPSWWDRPVTGVGETLVVEGLYPPGEHIWSLRAQQASEAEYHIELERLDRFGCPVDCEPNLDQAFASPVPPSMVIEGSTTAWNGNDPKDYYALPRLEEAQELVLRGDAKYPLKVLAENEVSKSLVEWDADAGVYRGAIPAGVLTYLEVSGANEHYRIMLEYANGPEPSPGAATPEVTLALDLGRSEVKAYREYGQRIRGELGVTNTGDQAVTLALETATSDRRWSVELARETVDLGPGQDTAIPLTVVVPDDAWANRDVRVSLQASTLGGNVTTHQDIAVNPTAEPASPARHFALPEPLLGGFNLAAARFGGAWTADSRELVGGNWADTAIDGVAVPNNGFRMSARPAGETEAVVLDLAGDEPVEIVGVTIDLLVSELERDFLRILDLSVSNDGNAWEPVLFERLDPVGGEQAFVFEEPVSARYVRFVPEHNWRGTPQWERRVGEFKVIARPGFDPSGGLGFNVAQRALGGRVVWHRPHIDSGWANVILRDQERYPSIQLESGETSSWVIGFHHDRAAWLDRLEWAHQSGDTGRKRFEAVQVSVSMASPLGPWQPVGEWTLSQTEETDVFRPEAPFWARYVRFTARAGEERGGYALPAPLRAWEVPSSGDYRSVLAEWGEMSRESLWETTQPVSVEPRFVRAPNDARDRAAALAVGESVSGAVLLADHEHWYRLEVPAGMNTLTATLAGFPTVRAILEAETAQGEPVRFRRAIQKGSASEHVFEAVVETGSTVFINVQEPPRNVVFAWDTSPSVAPFVPVIYQALMEYSAQVRPGLDAVNMMPFGHGMLLEEWFSEPYVLQTVINEYPRRESSSQAEQTLANASRALEPRPGTKAVLLITDAMTPRYTGGLWDALEAARPRVFGLGANIVAGSPETLSDVTHAHDLMQGWTAVNGGHFSQLLSAGELEVAFDRAQTLLREPAPYELRVEAAFREAPGPGTLAVIAGEGGAASGAVELILDASGSMLQRIAGKRRIAIAKEVLTEAVNEWIPEGTPVALRVFGHREPNACRTDLEVSLAPLDRASVANTISGINAKNLAKTPIADSLAAAAGDLAGAEGKVSILMLTDGEETCEGDPAEAIAELEEKGIDVTLNIVGFAINDDATESQFTEWATLGGGRYFAATDQAGLANAVNDALKAPFNVYDESGARVAQGLVGGEPVELEAGFYRVVVGGATPRTFDDVEVPGERETKLKLE